jgi:hypothetical protein
MRNEPNSSSGRSGTPWLLGVVPCRNMLVQRGVIGYKAHPVLFGEWICVGIEAKVR